MDRIKHFPINLIFSSGENDTIWFKVSLKKKQFPVYGKSRSWIWEPDFKEQERLLGLVLNLL